MTANDVQNDIRMRDLWSNNVMLAGSATAVLSILLPVVNQTGSLILLAVISLFWISAVGVLFVAISRWLSLRKTVRTKTANREWLQKSG